MNIQIIEGTEGAQQAEDIAIIIDVLRAATVSAYLLNAGVNFIVPVSTPNEAFDYKQTNPNVLLVGEDKGIKIPGFDIGNSPSEIKHRKDLRGKEAIHRSSTGTQGIVNAQNAKQIIFGSFVTDGAILSYLKNQPNQDITLVPMYALEDQLFAEYLRDHLTDNQPITIETIKDKLTQHEWLQKSFLDPDNHNFPEDDFHLSLETDVFDFFPIVHEGKIIKSTQL
jgi:2-phosphosulfolactate phosphatase